MLPFELLIIIFWTTISEIFNLFERFNVKIVKNIPTGLGYFFFYKILIVAKIL